MSSHPTVAPSKVETKGPRLARPLEIERTWGHAPHAGTHILDRFESAVAFAIREASRLQHEPGSGRAAMSRIEVSER